MSTYSIRFPAVRGVRRCPPESRRDRLRGVATLVLGRVLLLPALLRRPGHARELACHWALALRFPHTDLTGLTPSTREQFIRARTTAFWQDGQLIGLTSGYRDRATQEHLFAARVAESGSVSEAREQVLPAEESAHVAGVALDVRPMSGARWLEDHGGAHDLYRIYDNEWWHFEYRPGGRAPVRLPHPGVTAGPAAEPAP